MFLNARFYVRGFSYRKADLAPRLSFAPVFGCRKKSSDWWAWEEKLNLLGSTHCPWPHESSSRVFSLLKPACWQDASCAYASYKLKEEPSIFLPWLWGLPVTGWENSILRWVLGCSLWLPISTISPTSIVLQIIKLIYIYFYLFSIPYFSFASNMLVP